MSWMNEVELIALDARCLEVEWLESLTNDILLLSKHVSPISLHCDSPVAIARVKSKYYNEKRMHFTVRCKSIRYALCHGVVKLCQIRK